MHGETLKLHTFIVASFVTKIVDNNQEVETRTL